MMINPLDFSTSTGSTASNQVATAKNTLDQADFLKLLVTQMTSQNPLSPQSNTDMAAQMAQFTALQASQGTEKSIQVLQAKFASFSSRISSPSHPHRNESLSSHHRRSYGFFPTPIGTPTSFAASSQLPQRWKGME